MQYILGDIMNSKEILDYIEDKDFKFNKKWFYHATNYNISIIKNILVNGIKCAYLRKESSSGGYNGKYYVSLGSVCDKNNEIYKNFNRFPKFIINGISPIKTNQINFGLMTETILPFRHSFYEGEYHKFLKINSSKIIALEYSLSNMISGNIEYDIQQLKFLKELVMCIDDLNKDLPIYDFFSNKEINKEKVRYLTLDK